MRPQQHVVRLTASQRRDLERLVRKGKTPTAVIRHAHVLLSVDAGGPAWKDDQAAQAFRCHRNSIALIRKKYATAGLKAALHRKKQDKPSRERVLDGAGEAKLIAVACSKAPEGRLRWTLKLLADRLVELEVVASICDQTVRRTLKKMNFDPTSAMAG